MRSKERFQPEEHLTRFAAVACHSKEYQGDGWGCAYLQDERWHYYRNACPVWEDDLEAFPQTRLLLAHARSAFKNEGIDVTNNMPFSDDRYVFVFNGELRGVRLKEEGRIGAEKLFNYIRRCNDGDMALALRKGVSIIQRRTRYIRAMNIIIADTARTYVCSVFNEAPEYFAMSWKRVNDLLVVCSQPYEDGSGWETIPNNTIATC